MIDLHYIAMASTSPLRPALIDMHSLRVDIGLKA